MSVRWLAESYEGDRLVARVGRDGDVLVAEWIGLASFRANRDGSGVVFEPESGAPSLETKKLERGPARLLRLHLEGGIPLHGAAVAIDDRAVVILGAPEQGKSTLAASLCLAEGARLLADDAVAIEKTESGGFVVLCLEDLCWLDGRASRALGIEAVESSPKRPVAVASAPNKPEKDGGAPKVERLDMIVQLEYTEGMTVDLVRLTGIEAIAGILKQLTRLVVDEPAVAKRDLEALADLTLAVPVFRLTRPRNLERLPESVALLAATLREKTR